MVSRRRRHSGNRSKRLVSTSVVLLLVALGRPGFSQGVEISLSNTQLREGQELLVQLEVDYPTPEEVRIIGDLDVPKLSLTDGPTMQTVRDVRFSDQLRTLVQIVYRANTAGRTILPAFEIAVAGQSFTTEPRLLSIIDPDVGEEIIPPDLAWRVSSVEPYEGEAVSVLLELTNLTDFTFPDELSVTNPASGLFQEVQGIGSVQRTAVNGVELLAIPIATFIFTPSEPGSVTIPPARMRLGPFSRMSEPVVLDVRPLPEPVTATGAVGRFQFEVWSDAEDVRVGDSVTVTMRVEGEGNLDFFRFPALEVPNAIAIGTSEESRFRPSLQGYEGYRQQVVELSPQTAGALRVDAPAFSWVDPRLGRVRTQSPEPILISVESISEDVAEPDPEIRLEPLPVDSVRALERFRLHDRPAGYLLLLPGPLIFLSGLLWRRRRRLAPAVFLLVATVLLGTELRDVLVADGLSAMGEGRHLEAIDRFQTALVERPDSPGVHYNLAVAYQRIDEPAYTVFHLRRAVEERPLVSQLRDALRQVETDLGMEGQLEPGRLLHPDSYFVAGVVLFNLLFVVLAIRRIPRGGRIILATVLLLLSATSFSILAYRVTIGDDPVAVIGPASGALRRIPDVESNPWMTLAASTPVRVVKRMPPLVLVRTANGVEGWIAEGAVIDEDDDGR